MACQFWDATKSTTQSKYQGVAVGDGTEIREDKVCSLFLFFSSAFTPSLLLKSSMIENALKVQVIGRKFMFSSGQCFCFLHSYSTSRNTNSNLGVSWRPRENSSLSHIAQKVKSPLVRHAQITEPTLYNLCLSVFYILKHSLRQKLPLPLLRKGV